MQWPIFCTEYCWWFKICGFKWLLIITPEGFFIQEKYSPYRVQIVLIWVFEGLMLQICISDVDTIDCKSFRKFAKNCNKCRHVCPSVRPSVRPSVYLSAHRISLDWFLRNFISGSLLENVMRKLKLIKIGQKIQTLYVKTEI